MKRIQISKEDIKEYWKKRKERWEPVRLWMNRFSLLLHALLACVINFIIEAVSRYSVAEVWDYLVSTPWTFFFNAYMIFITFLLVYLVRRRVFTRIIITVLWLVIGFVNGYMLSVRVTPFNAQDLNVIDDALSMIDKYFTPVQCVLLIIGILAIIMWLIAMWRRAGKYTGKMYRIPALVAVVIAFGTMGLVTDLAIDKRVVSNYFGNIAFAYEDYGLPYCFSATVFQTGINQPVEYSEEKINKITKNGKYAEATSSRSAEDMPNIILLQLESFFDTDEAEFFTTSQDPIPTFHYLMDNYTSGYFQVPSVGAGTANTEFEVLTGMSMRYFGPGEYPYKTIAKKTPLESVATALKEFGYGAHALHNNDGNFYSRADVYNMMGFDSYTSKEFMNVLQYTEEGWATDSVLTEHILNALDSTKQQDFVFGVTVEAHGSYDHKLENPLIQVSGIEDEKKRIEWEYFVNCLHGTDQFIAELLEELEKRGEPTVLVLYGDHLPTMGLQAQDLKSRYLFNTNYVIWDNIGLEEKDRNLPTYQLVADVFQKLDMHTGTVFNYHQNRRKTKQYLFDLELLQYDMLYGKQYVYGGSENAPQVDGEFRMGIKDVTLSGMEILSDGTPVFYGENLTVDSYLYVNGKKEARPTFINDTRIEAPGLSLEEGDVIVVNQLGTNSRIFHSSPEYVFREGTLILKTENVVPEVTFEDADTAPIEAP